MSWLWTTARFSGANWNNDHFTVDNNLYWDCAGNELRFGKLSFAEWQAKGHDVHSIVAESVVREYQGL